MMFFSSRRERAQGNRRFRRAICVDLAWRKTRRRQAPVGKRLLVSFDGFLFFAERGVDARELGERGVFPRAVFQFAPERDGLFEAFARFCLFAAREMNLADAGERSGYPRPVVDRPRDRQALLIKINRFVRLAELLMYE